MSELKPLPCPFCGGAPRTVARPDNIDGTRFFYALACYCGGYSACAHKMAVEPTPEQAKRTAIEAWNRRAQPAQAGQGTKVKEPHFAPQEAITEDGWTEWVCPKPKGYLAQCCDCGLVHEIDTRVAKYEPRPSENFEVVTDPDLQVQWRVRRRDDLRQEIREIPAFEPDQTPDLEAGKSRFYSAQAGQVLTLDEVRESVHEAGLDWHNGWTMGEDAENRYLNLCRAVEQAVLAKRVPMTPEETDKAMRSMFYPARNRAFIDGVEAAELHHGIVGEKGGTT